ncbi:MAG: hypothetical protein ACU0GG_05110 [Paracoccaceae bacterium]
MTTRIKSENITPDYPGSANHHALKGKDGKTGQTTDDLEGNALPEDMERAVKTSDADTEIAEEFRKAVSSDDDRG